MLKLLGASALVSRVPVPSLPRLLGERPVPRAGQSRELPRLQDIALSGELGARYQAAVTNILTRRDRYSLESFRSSARAVPGALWWDWPGDQIGRWLSDVHVATALGWPDESTQRRAVIEAILPLQASSGNFGIDAPTTTDGRVVSGNAFALRGLMDTYEDTGDERLVAAARRLARYFDGNQAYWGHRGPDGSTHEFYGHCIDGLVKLHRIARDPAALQLAETLASSAGRTHHTHHSLSMYRGLLDLYALTGNEEYLRKTQSYLDWVNANRLVTGGVPESLPSSEQDEGCALADYIVVNLMMYAATGRDAHLDDAELTLMNHFGMNQFRTGGFGHRAFGREVVGGKNWQGWEGAYGSENPGCCSMWGLWALAQVGQYVFVREGNALDVNLYPSTRASFEQGRLALRLTSDYPHQRLATLTVDAAPPSMREIRFRIPRWADGVGLAVNGAPVKVSPTGTRLVLTRVWRAGDTVRVSFASVPRVVRWPASDAPNVAVFDGPLCLGLSSTDASVDEEARVETDAGGVVRRSGGGRPVANISGRDIELRPIASDWLSPDVKNPNRLRTLFKG